MLKNPAGDWNYSTIGGSSSETAKPDKPASTASSSAPPGVTVKKLELENGKIIVGTTKSQQRTTYDHVNVTASDFSLNSRFPISVTADLPGGGNMKLDGNIGPVDKTDSTLTPLDAKLHVGSLNLASSGILDPSLGLGGIVDADTTLANQVASRKPTALLTDQSTSRTGWQSFRRSAQRPIAPSMIYVRGS